MKPSLQHNRFPHFAGAAYSMDGLCFCGTEVAPVYGGTNVPAVPCEETAIALQKTVFWHLQGECFNQYEV